jgi:hypothetical protein
MCLRFTVVKLFSEFILSDHFFPFRFSVILFSFQSFMSFVILFYQNKYCPFTDFTKEAKNSERTASCFRKNSVVKVPYVFEV